VPGEGLEPPRRWPAGLSRLRLPLPPPGLDTDRTDPPALPSAFSRLRLPLPPPGLDTDRTDPPALPSVFSRLRLPLPPPGLDTDRPGTEDCIELDAAAAFSLDGSPHEAVVTTERHHRVRNVAWATAVAGGHLRALGKVGMPKAGNERGAPAPGGILARTGAGPLAPGLDLRVGSAGGLEVVTIPDPDLANASYLVTVGDGIAVAVDPPRAVEALLTESAVRSLTIVAVLETHLHGDRLSGASELAEAGAVVVAPAAANLEFPHRAVEDATVVLVGDVEIHARTVGNHTADHVAYVVVSDGSPLAAFIGSTTGPVAVEDAWTFDDDVGEESEDPDPTAGDALDLRQPSRWRPTQQLPSDLPLYATHATADGRPSTIADLVIVHEPDPRSGDVTVIAEANRRGPRLRRDTVGAEPLSADEMAARIQGGAWLVDTRPPAAWCDGHIPLSLAAPAGPWFAWLLPRLVPPDAPIVLVSDRDDLDACFRAARTAGHDELTGWMAGGWPAWTAARGAVESVHAATPVAIASLRATGITTLDVRSEHERARRRLPACQPVALSALAAGIVATDDEVAVVCSDGVRATAAASVLAARGVRVHVLAGGLDAWHAAGMAVIEG